MPLTRRSFLHTAAATGVALRSSSLLASTSARKYRTALIGSGWWGMNVLREAMAAENAKVVALCDVDQNVLAACADQVQDVSSDQPKLYTDYREMLDKEKPEVVIIATPDHWHALITIAALKAGAHVFVEKPTGHTVQESRAMLNAAHDSGKVVQVGLHRRIGPHHVSGMKFLKEGHAGNIGMVRMFVYSKGDKENPTANAEPPRGLDWDMYCGPAPLRPFCRKIHPGGWRNFLSFANGTLGDWGVHWLDQVLWWTDEKFPKRIFSSGSRHIAGQSVLTSSEQTTDTPDSQVAVYEFESFTAVWEHRKFSENPLDKHKVGCYYYGTKGIFHMGWRDGWTFYPADGKSPIVHENPQLQEPDGHNLKLLWADFIDGIENGRRPAADVELAHRSTNLSLLGMLSYKLGRSVHWDGDREQIIGDAEANQLLKREYREPWQYPT